VLLAAATTTPLLLPLARAQEPPASTPAPAPPADPRPFPALDPGMHTAIINRIAVDRASRWLVTASDDKTARVWDLTNGGRLAMVLRVPVGEGNEGKLYAVALSPDGALVALGGFTGPAGKEEAIYLFERASGRLLQRLGGLPSSVSHLAFSADGRRLAAALGGANGIRVYEAGAGGRWAQQAADAAYGDSSYSVEFDGKGRLLATSGDGDLRLYAAGQRGTLTTLQRRPAPGGREPFSARFSPDGRRIAVGFNDSTAIAVLDGASLAPLSSPDTSTIRNGNLGIVAWSADGQRLLAAGRYIQADGSVPLAAWPSAGGAPQLLPLGMTNTVMDLRPLADGRLVYGGGGPAWGVLGTQLQPTTLFRGPPVLDHRSDAASRNSHAGYEEFRLAPAGEGRWLEFRAVSRDSPDAKARLVRFDLAERRLLLPATPAPAGLTPRSTGLPIDGWFDTTSPTLAGKPLPLEKYERSRSLAISADRQRFALGSEWYVSLFGADGQPRWRTSTPSVAWLVNLSPDGRFVVAALGDGTIRWYRSQQEGAAAAGSEALALFVHPDLQRWILWTPEGFYDASPGGAELLGYQLNNGREAAATFIRSAQLQKQFFRPDLIARRLSGSAQNDAAIAAAVAEVGDVRQVLMAGRPPLLRPDTRDGEAMRTLPNGDVEIRFQVVDQGGGVGDLEVRLNGVRIEARQNLRIGDRPALVITPPPRRPNQPSKPVLTIAAANSRGVLGQPLRFELTSTVSQEPPTLHVLAVGITNYKSTVLRSGVRFAAADARALVTTLQRPGILADARLGSVVLIPEGEASRERIRQELRAMAARVKPGDRFVLHLAGHGTALDGEYYFLTQELDNDREAAIRRQALSGNDLRELLRPIQASGGTLLLLDTCSSGTYGSPAQSDLQSAVRRFEELDGRLMLAAAGDRRMALESPFQGRGIFTAVVIEGLLGKADKYGDDRVVRATELLSYVVEIVPEITEREFRGVRQQPFQSSKGNFPLTRSGTGAP
jgi:WD40 repeat protein